LDCITAPDRISTTCRGRSGGGTAPRPTPRPSFKTCYWRSRGVTVVSGGEVECLGAGLGAYQDGWRRRARRPFESSRQIIGESYHSKGIFTQAGSIATRATERRGRPNRLPKIAEVPIFPGFVGLERAKGIEPSYAAWEAVLRSAPYPRHMTGDPGRVDHCRRGPPRIRVHVTGGLRPFSKDSVFHRQPYNGNLKRPRPNWGLHRPNPVAQKMPGFIGFFPRRK
jgi:hypothetical protein